MIIEDGVSENKSENDLQITELQIDYRIHADRDNLTVINISRIFS